MIKTSQSRTVVVRQVHTLKVVGAIPTSASCPRIPTVEKVDLESIQCKFESYLGHLGGLV